MWAENRARGRSEISRFSLVPKVWLWARTGRGVRWNLGDDLEVESRCRGAVEGEEAVVVAAAAAEAAAIAREGEAGTRMRVIPAGQ